MSAQASLLYEAAMAQLAAESYLDRIDLSDLNAFAPRLINGNNHFLDPARPTVSVPPEAGAGATRFSSRQLDQFAHVFDIIDHLPNQSSGFSATLLKNKATGEYTLAFRSTEYRNIEDGGDAQRDSIRGAAGDIAFNGMALGQVSSMERYWSSLLDGTRAQGATPDQSIAGDTTFLRTAELDAFKSAMASGAKINVSGYSLGGHLATVFSTFHGDQVGSLYLFNSSGVGRIRDGFGPDAYRTALETYETFIHPERMNEVADRVLDWASRATLGSEVGRGARVRFHFIKPWPTLGPEHLFLPREFHGHAGITLVPEMEFLIGGLLALAWEKAWEPLPQGADGMGVRASSAQHFLVSLFATEALEGTYAQALKRGMGETFLSLQESGLIPGHVKIHQVSGLAASGASSIATFGDMAKANDWNIVADSGIRAAADSELHSIYIEDQPVAAGWPLSDSGWGDFGNTHSITLLVDSLAVTRMLQKAQPSLSQATAESVYRAASNLRKEWYDLFPAEALVEHDTLERVVDAFGRVLFGRNEVGDIDWATDLASADGVSSFGLLAYRDPFYGRIQAIEDAIAARALVGSIELVSLVGWSRAEIVAAAREPGSRGTAVRYALKELNPFFVVAPGLYEALDRPATLALHDAALGTGAITNEWIEDRADFLALKLRLGTADHAYETGEKSIRYSAATGEIAVAIAQVSTAGLLAPEAPIGKRTRAALTRLVDTLSGAALGSRIAFGADGNAAANPSTLAGGADILQGGAGTDRLYGEAGNDKLIGGAGADYLEGGSGDDELNGGPGNDTLVGGLGFDSYFWSLGDGFDRIVDAREEGELRGRIVLRFDTQLLVPRLLERDPGAAVETWRSPDGNVLLTHTTSWVLTFLDGAIDLGPDVRSGDFGLRLEGIAPPRPPTLLDGVPLDHVIVGPNRGTAILVGEYGHDTLYAEVPLDLEAALLIANDAPRPGWGFWLSGGPGDDTAIATAAADIVLGGGGADTLVGGPGDDLMDGDADQVPILNGYHLLWDYRPDPADGYFTEFHAPGLVTGATGFFTELFRDQIVDGDDVLYGGGGNDRMYGGGGDDLLYGDPGDDLLVGGAGSDLLVGGEGDDRITGELHGYAPVGYEVIGGTIVTYPHYVPAYGDDILDGGPGADVLTGEGGADVLFGGDGADTLYGDIAGLPGELHGNDIADGGLGDDLIYGQGGDDLLLGGAGNDLLVGDSDVEARFHGADTLEGDDGDDELIGAGGADRLFGGAGADTLVGDALDVPAEFQLGDLLDGGDGNDTLYGLGGADELFGGEGADRLYGDDPETPALGEADLLDGGEGDDILYGHGGDDLLRGGSGDDALYGGDGHDTLVGGPGADLLDGGSGDNVYQFAAGDGVDRLIADSGLAILDFVDGIDFGALTARRELSSTAGAAPLHIRYSATDLVIVEGLGDARRLRIRIGGVDVLDADELLQLTQSGSTSRVGSGASELLVADAAHPDVFGLDGNDVLAGSDGADRLHGGAGDDVLHGMAGDDKLLGGSGADVLSGGAGNDRLEGGFGNDRYVFEPGAGVDTLREMPGAGYDVIALGSGMPLASIRLRRSGADLVITERGGSGRLFVADWYLMAGLADRGIDALLHTGGTLETDAIVAREISDRILQGTAVAETLTGDEFADIVIGGAGDDLLAGLDGDDHYVYALGDGNDTILDTGGFDTLELGAGISSGAIEFVGTPNPGGGLSIALRIGGASGEITFDEARANRLEQFRFASGEVYDYGTLLRRNGGLRIEGSEADDILTGSFFADALYGFGGNDTLSADAGNDWLVGGEGHDILVGGANHDTYVFNLGDGRDSILEYSGNDEYWLFRGYFTPGMHRAFDLEGIPFVTHEPQPGGAYGETFMISLGSVAGGIDTIRFGEGIAPEDIRFGLDLGKPSRPYSWLARDSSGAIVPAVLYAEEAAYILEIGDSGDAIEVLWPLSERFDFTEEDPLDSIPVEQLLFGDDEPVAFAELFWRAGGLTYLIGTAQSDTFNMERVLAGGWIAGGAGDDVYLRPEQGGLGIEEAVDGGHDTIVFGDAVTADGLRLKLEQERLFIDTGVGRIELRGFSATDAERALVERFEFADGSSTDYASLLFQGIEVAGTPFDDRLTGTAAYDDVRAGAGDDVIDSGAGDDIIDGAAGNDTIFGGAGDDGLHGGTGDDVLRGGPGRDRYLFLRGDGHDVIEEQGQAGEADSLRFGGDIVPGEVSARREGGDLVLALPASDGRVTLREWFDSDAMRVESVHFNDGAMWDVATLAALAGEPTPVDPAPIDPSPVDPSPGDPAEELPPVVSPGDPSAEAPVDPVSELPIHPPGEPPIGPPGEPPEIAEPPGVPPVPVEDPPEASPAMPPQQPPMGSHPPAEKLPVPGIPEVDTSLAPGSSPTPGSSVASPSGEGSESAMAPSASATASSFAPPGAVPGIGERIASGEAAVWPGVGSASVLSSDPSSPSPAPHSSKSGHASGDSATEHGSESTLASGAATLEHLAASGFISPGRARGVDEDASAEAIDPEAEPAEEVPAESAGERAVGWDRYWRWMHARLDAHLEAADVEDLGAPPMHDYRSVVPGWDDGVGALAHSRSVGVRDRSVFEARSFEGLRDGFARLG